MIRSKIRGIFVLEDFSKALECYLCVPTRTDVGCVVFLTFRLTDGESVLLVVGVKILRTLRCQTLSLISERLPRFISSKAESR